MFCRVLHFINSLQSLNVLVSQTANFFKEFIQNIIAQQFIIPRARI